MKSITQKIIIVAALAIATAVPATLYLNAKGQPALETFVRANDPTATLIASKIRACGQSTEWETEALYKADSAIEYSSDWSVWGSLDHRASTADLAAQCKANGLKTLHGDCKAIAVLVASTAAHLDIPWRLRSRTGQFWTFSSGHVWAEVKLSGAWYSVGATSDANPELPAEAAPALPAAGAFVRGNNKALIDYVNFRYVTL